MDTAMQRISTAFSFCRSLYERCCHRQHHTLQALLEKQTWNAQDIALLVAALQSSKDHYLHLALPPSASTPVSGIAYGILQPLRNSLSRHIVTNSKALAHLLFHVASTSRRVQSLCSQSVTVKGDGTLLQELWGNLMSGTVSFPSPKWQDLGFQGQSPVTDFRSMGRFGLVQLVSASRSIPAVMKSIIDNMDIPVSGWPVVLGGIHFSNFIREALYNHELDGYLYTALHARVHAKAGEESKQTDEEEENEAADKGLQVLNELYVRLMTEFQLYWDLNNPRDMMDFEPIANSFKTQTRRSLKEHGSIFSAGSLALAELSH